MIQTATMSQGVLAAFQQAGRPVPVIADIAAQKGFMVYWSQNASKGYTSVATIGGATSSADLMVKTILRTLAGQGPKVNQLIWRHPIVSTRAQMQAYVNKTWTPDTIGTVENPKSTWWTDKDLDRFSTTPIARRGRATRTGWGAPDRALPASLPPMSDIEETAAVGTNSVQPAPLVEVADVAKAFGATQALRDCLVRAAAGEVHALVGENGSRQEHARQDPQRRPRARRGLDRARGGAPARRTPPRRAAARIVTVFQEVLVAGARSVLDNVWLGVDGLCARARRGREKRGRAREMLSELLGRAGDLDTPVEELSLSRSPGLLHRPRARCATRRC